MKKIIPVITFSLFVFSAYAQNTRSNNMLVRHDTTLLQADDCAWIVKSLVKNDPALTSEIGKPVSLIILQAIEKGRLKAIDPETNKPIPSNEIFTWKMAGDTLPEYDEDGNIKRYLVMKRQHSPDRLNRLRIYQDWYFDVSTGKFNSVIKWIELLEKIETAATGHFIGYAVFCRVYY